MTDREGQHLGTLRTVTIHGSSYGLILVTVSINPGMKLHFHNSVEPLTGPPTLLEDHSLNWSTSTALFWFRSSNVGGPDGNRTRVQNHFCTALTCLLRFLLSALSVDLHVNSWTAMMFPLAGNIGRPYGPPPPPGLQRAGTNSTALLHGLKQRPAPRGIDVSIDSALH
jgi:hypothetical protein